ncbi:FecR family protein [Spirosoma panaciterrae]|uniref:FecR family protein n=1 Tax=Spirosoma panaciterrae TaxID=496058 RepID=UPI000371E9D8|nr:FecR family protein [Spirosoma panaciterrae]
MDTKSLEKKVLFDYFDGKSSSIQRKMVEEWLEIPQNNELYYQYLDEWEQQHPQYVFDIETGLSKVHQQLDQPIIDVPAESPSIRVLNSSDFYRIGRWVSAALVILVAGWFSWNQLKKPKPVTYEKLVKLTKNSTGEIYEKVNLTKQPILINLPDKSSVILQPNSKICYSPKQYNQSKREVILSGEAFFEVQKNRQKPFFVYANELVTKVLGTSFFIKSQPTNTDMEVIVKTGRVAVFLQHDANKLKKLTNTSLTGLVLNANERVQVNGAEFSIKKPTRIDQESLSLPIQKLTFNFDETPAVDVLTELEKAYGIDIVFEKNKLTNCKLTAHLSDEPLMEKLELICAALEATYKEVDNKIILQVKGCP